MVTEAAFISECLMDGRPCAYLQTHTVSGTQRTVRNEWFAISEGPDGTPVFTPHKAPPGMVESLTVDGSPAWFALFSPAALKNIDTGLGLGMSVFCRGAGRRPGRGPGL